jgi:hypothetical protein
VHQHVINNSAPTDLLNALEPVNRTQRFDHLRWTLGHIYDISGTDATIVSHYKPFVTLG